MTRIAGQRLIGRLCGALGACGAAAGAAAARLVLGVGRAEEAGGAGEGEVLIDGQQRQLVEVHAEEGGVVLPVAGLNVGRVLAVPRVFDALEASLLLVRAAFPAASRLLLVRRRLDRIALRERAVFAVLEASLLLRVPRRV